MNETVRAALIGGAVTVILSAGAWIFSVFDGQRERIRDLERQTLKNATDIKNLSARVERDIGYLITESLRIRSSLTSQTDERGAR